MPIDLDSYIQQCAINVAPSTMLAIVRVESGGNPWAIGLNQGQRLRFPAQSLLQATAWVNYLEAHGYDFDVGLGQVNVRNVHKYGYKAHDMLEPCKNLWVASTILTKNYQGALLRSLTPKEALFKAISAYNTGNYNHGFTNGYVQRVIANAFSQQNLPLKVVKVKPPDKMPVHYKSRVKVTALKSVIYAEKKAKLP